jgi:hypothetical protein
MTLSIPQGTVADPLDDQLKKKNWTDLEESDCDVTSINHYMAVVVNYL